ncbi:hypothetical protein DYU05_14055 [Mucilaginibacter terrenus]|uniref:Outer membrane protein beta-barrel domain-containing protein n=1 Tax=Mucilaginibacter terrenus TaxID=2482727 RepID=A0A3E2NQI5_9SPHI|nr:hypothetical protein [Mucilaginibacter terrenus]RFZ83257.1 hypothetical protein DYU05_14055 [Mucilaginibacter terrenus]
MNEEQDNIDKLFRSRLEDPGDNLAFNDADWDSLEEMLDKGKKPKILSLPIISAVAALLLLFFGWMLFKPQTNNQTENKADQSQVAVKPKQQSVPATGDTVNKVAGTSFTSPVAAKNEGNGKNRSGSRATPPVVIYIPVIPPSSGNVEKDTLQQVLAGAFKTIDNTIQQDTTPPTAVAGTTAGSQIAADVTTPAAVKSPTVKVRKAAGIRPQFALGVIASSDINGVNSLSQNKVGSNFGVSFSVTVKKLTFITGAVYAIKPYATSFSNYNSNSGYMFPENPLNITADCRMLDIPLNVSYQVYKGGRNKFALGTGLSSYVMLHENYKYTYASGSSAGPANYVVPNPQSYLMSAVNFNATFERQLSPKFSLSVQPYFKVPLKAVGYSQVNLHTTGVAIGFNWNINSFTKP